MDGLEEREVIGFVDQHRFSDLEVFNQPYLGIHLHPIGTRSIYWLLVRFQSAVLIEWIGLGVILIFSEKNTVLERTAK